ncbi:MAG: DUF92 domain-containing protein [Gemmatimonadaceae bacterium]
MGGEGKLTGVGIAFKRARLSPMAPAQTQTRVIVLSEQLFRAFIGAIAAAVISFAARRAHILSPSGVAASVVAGSVAVAAGWTWGTLLLAFFLSAAGLSAVGAPRKAAILNAVVAKTGDRDGWQVAANGALFTAAAAAYMISPSPIWQAVGAGALAASSADTWATELGTLFGKQPRSMISGAHVPAGTSGGVSLAGWMAAVGGAALVAGGAWLAHWPVPIYAVIAGGLAGSAADSLAGATIQERRWCDACGTSTERRVHGCGNTTRHAGGIARLDNDAVNLLCSAAGALVTLVLS